MENWANFELRMMEFGKYKREPAGHLGFNPGETWGEGDTWGRPPF
jgi:hypothetical protein